MLLRAQEFVASHPWIFGAVMFVIVLGIIVGLLGIAGVRDDADARSDKYASDDDERKIRPPENKP